MFVNMSAQISANVIRLERLALLLVLVIFGIVFQGIQLVRALIEAAAALVSRRSAGGKGHFSNKSHTTNPAR
jgi:hypothetical protein